MTDKEIIERMRGNIVGGTIEEAIEQYRALPHTDYSFDGGCICVCELPDFYFVAFAWCDNTISARKNFLKTTDIIYENGRKPFLFTGVKNYFSGRSVEICENIWQYVPKVL